MHTSTLMKCLKLSHNMQLTFVRSISTLRPLSAKNYYKTLELDRNCSDKDVREAYIRLSKEHHPDRNRDVSDKRFVEINEAYSVLGKPATRKRYDTFLHDNPWTAGQQKQWNSTYEELNYHYNARRMKRHQMYRDGMEYNIPATRIISLVVLAMFFVGLLEFYVVKKVVKRPDEIIEGMPVYYTDLVAPDLSRMSPEEIDEYHAAKRRIIVNTVRSMKADNESRQREQERLRAIMENNAKRQKDTGFTDE